MMSDERGASNAVGDTLEENRLSHERWEKALCEGTILGVRCEECDTVTATPKAACTGCGSRSLTVVELPETGVVYTKTTVEVAPEEHGSGYQIAVVDFGEARLLGRVADGDRVEIGDETRLKRTYEHAGDIAAVFESVES